MLTEKDSNITDVKLASSNLSGDGRDNAIDLLDVANKAGHKVRSMYKVAKEEIGGDIDKVTSQIRRKPLQSSMIALGVGVLLGALFRRA